MYTRIATILGLLFTALLLISGCGGALGGNKGVEPTPTPKVASVPDPADAFPAEVATVYIAPVGTVDTYIPPVPSKPAHIDSTPTDSVSDAKGDTPETDAIVQKWKDAFRNMHTISGKQEIMRIGPDGTISPPPSDQYSGLLSTEETYVLTDVSNNIFSFRFKATTRQGYMLAVFDGSGDYVIWSEVPNEVYRTLPESKIRSTFFYDYENMIDASFVHILRPQNVTYTLVGKSNLNGHSVIELKQVPVQVNLDQHALIVYLDESNYLPYRYIDEPIDGQSGQQLTIDDMKINEFVSESDLKAGLPDPKDAVTIFLTGYKSTPLPTYTSLRDPQLNPGFNLFEPANGSQGVISTATLIEKDGIRTPMLSFGIDGGSIYESAYLPQIKTYPWPLSDDVREPDGTPLDVGGLPGTMLTNSDGVRIRFQRDGTWIQVQAQTLDNALKIAENMQPVKQTVNDTK